MTIDRQDRARPVTLGEGAGHGAIGASFTLQEATAPPWHDHLAATGCGWLIALAAAERARGVPFTGDEIVAVGVAYQQAGMAGLCAEGAWEVALGAVRPS